MKSVCESVSESSPKFEPNQNGHNSVNFEATASRFCMVVALEEEDKGVEVDDDDDDDVDDDDDDDTSKNVFLHFFAFYFFAFFEFLHFLPFLCFFVFFAFFIFSAFLMFFPKVVFFQRLFPKVII